ncbi:MAG: phosphopentomutase [Oscillospiraceae bacterium]
MADVKRVFLIVLDSLGIGALPDAAEYGDVGSNTLASVTRSSKLNIPNLQALGLYNIFGVEGPKVSSPAGAYGRMAQQSKGKDTTIGHWEIAGIISSQPMPTYPNGFPPEVLKALEQATGRGFLCNLPYSGTQVIADFGREHLETGKLILYTSADSVMQIAAHEELIPLEELYDICRKARQIMKDRHGVGRIIARPFVGAYPHFVRTANRHDFSLEPTGPTMMDTLLEWGYNVIGVGKISDIFAGVGIQESTGVNQNNADGMEKTLALAKRDFTGLCFVNLVDFDMLYGHRNDVDGYAQALTEFDLQLGELLSLLGPHDVLMITADHGCDPATPSTDHSREYVPLLVTGQGIRREVDLGTRATFADVAATVQDLFSLPIQTAGESFRHLVCR